MKQVTEQKEGTKVIDSRQLLEDQKQVHIKHGDAVYRLCVTRENKLILTK